MKKKRSTEKTLGQSPGVAGQADDSLGRKTKRARPGGGDRERPTGPTGEKRKPRKGSAFPVAGIGASAGGLEAMTELLRYLPADINMAFVLVQHLSPHHVSMMTDLLKRETQLAVSEIIDGVRVEPAHLYIIPPNAKVGILNGTLHLLPLDTDDNLRHLPIDYFFQSLASERGSNAIGIILSGSASDGTLGTKAIKGGDGITFAQDVETAAHKGMPTSAIASGCIDFALSPEGIAKELKHIASHPDIMRAEIPADGEPPGRIDSELGKIFMLLRNRTGNDFTYYKHSTIHRRIARRMLVHKIGRLKDYVRLLDAEPGEVDALFHDILINVTGFFRNPEAFETIKKTIFAAVMSARAPESPIRIWIPGCSSGEEVYSIVIALLEYLDEAATSTPIQVFATDIDDEAIAKARAGIYNDGITADISPERLRRFFTKVPQGYQISKHLREMCVFAQQNVITDPPFTHQDLIACRNLLIYLGTELQRKAMQMFHYALNPNGYLFLGNAESVGAAADLFVLVDNQNKIYRKKGEATRPRAIRASKPMLPAPAARQGIYPQPRQHKRPDLQHAAESIILDRYAPPGVVINNQLDALLYIGQSGHYLQPGPGTASLNLLKLVHPDLAIELRVAVHAAIRERKRVRQDNASLHRNGGVERVAIEVLPLGEQVSDEPQFLVLFCKLGEHAAGETPERANGDDDAPETGKDARIRELTRELEATKSYMQTTIEDQETANEELQSANEEIQSTNEELQSTNEELETTKEELQSTNEELVTVNEELERRHGELTTLYNDFVNLINSADLPLIVVGEDLVVRYFSPQAHRLLNLIDTDIGRPIGDIRPNVDAGDISVQVRQVMETLKAEARDVHDDQGHWYSMRIRPYRTSNNRITGAVVVFVEFTELRESLARARRLVTVVEDSNDAITVQDLKGRIQAWNPAAVTMYGYSEDEALNSGIDIITPEELQQEMLEKIVTIRNGGAVRPFTTWRCSKNGKRLQVLVSMSALCDEQRRPVAVATTERLLNG